MFGAGLVLIGSSRKPVASIKTGSVPVVQSAVRSSSLLLATQQHPMTTSKAPTLAPLALRLLGLSSAAVPARARPIRALGGAVVMTFGLALATPGAASPVAAAPTAPTAPGWTPIQPQALPTTLDRAITTTTTALSGAQTAVLKTFVEGWIDQIANGKDANEWDEARRTLIEPLRDPAASSAFRRAFATIALPKLDELVAGKDSQKAIYAMQVARYTRTTESVELLKNRISPETESDAGKRLAAASTLAEALTNADLNQPQFDAVIRAITSAAEREKNPLVVLQLLDALVSIVKRSGGQNVTPTPPLSVAAARDAQVKVIHSLVDSIAAGKTADARMAAVQRAVLSMRNQWVDIKGPERTALGTALAPALVDVISIAQNHWESGHKDERLTRTYGDAVVTVETMLRIIDKAARPNAAPSPEKVLGTAWDNSSKSDFDAEFARLKGIVAAPPYR